MLTKAIVTCELEAFNIDKRFNHFLCNLRDGRLAKPYASQNHPRRIGDLMRLSRNNNAHDFPARYLINKYRVNTYYRSRNEFGNFSTQGHEQDSQNDRIYLFFFIKPIRGDFNNYVKLYQDEGKTIDCNIHSMRSHEKFSNEKSSRFNTSTRASIELLWIFSLLRAISSAVALAENMQSSSRVATRKSNETCEVCFVIEQVEFELSRNVNGRRFFERREATLSSRQTTFLSFEKHFL